MTKHEKNRQKFTISLKMVLSLSNVAHAWGALDMSMGHT